MQLAALQGAARGQVEGRQQLRLRRGERGVRRQQQALRLDDIGPPVKQLRRQQLRHPLRHNLVELRATRDLARVHPYQNAQSVLLLGDLMPELRHLRLRRLELGRRLHPLQPRTVAGFELALRQLQRIATRLKRRLGDAQLLIQRHQAQIARRYRAGDGQLRRRRRRALRLQRRFAGRDAAAARAPQVDIVARLQQPLIDGALVGLAGSGRERALMRRADARAQRREVVALRRAQFGAILFDARTRREDIEVIAQRLRHQPVKVVVAEGAPPLRFRRGGGSDLITPLRRDRQRCGRFLYLSGAAGQRERRQAGA